MQLGFVIDHSRCIGCHACTVACKAENDVPLGSFRTWVKYIEQGEFPGVVRSFAVLRCNQCSAAPCVEICPVRALEKRPDGIVDVDPARCIGCKGCMQACPYDALYINEDNGTAEKCHFCAHRTELGLAPACAVVCPTEAIIPGDFHDPRSKVSRMKGDDGLQARRTEAGTGPNVFYKEVARAAIEPLETNAAGGYLWANQLPGIRLEAQLFESLERRASARTVYDVEHPPPWGGKVTAYLFAKSIAAGLFLAGALLQPPFSLGDGMSTRGSAWTAGLSLVFLLLTTALLVLDLKRPGRFLYILRYPNWSSWLARGAIVLAAYGALASLWLALQVLDVRPRAAVSGSLVGATSIGALLTAVYTAWLFGQAHGRPLWMGRGLTLSLAVHAVVAGAAALILLAPVLELTSRSVDVLRTGLVAGLAVHLVLGLLEGSLAPAERGVEYRRAMRLITHGPFARRHWLLGVFAGTIAPLALLLTPAALAWVAASALALIGLLVTQDILVRAGQALPIS